MQPRQSSSEALSYPMPASAEGAASAYEQAPAGLEAADSNIEAFAISLERQDGVSDASSDSALQAAATASQVLPAPQPLNVAAQAPLHRDDNPIIAADDDLIEKEWVDKAKKIILDTRDDPFRREQEIAKLQIDYIKKRYGRVIGESASR